MAKVKICGISHDAEIKIMNELMPDYVGFVFYGKSRKFISPEHAAYLRAKLKRGIKSVGVFKNATLEAVALSVETVGLDLVQLHGDETGEYIAALREYIKCPIIRRFKIASSMDADRAMYTTADYVMLDGGASGLSFDWSMIGTSRRRRFFLKGGITPDNVEQALNITPAPYALDVSTGVESGMLKDYRKVMKFIQAVRSHKTRN